MGALQMFPTFEAPAVARFEQSAAFEGVAFMKAQ
jgi:hypothetical protein